MSTYNVSFRAKIIAMGCFFCDEPENESYADAYDRICGLEGDELSKAMHELNIYEPYEDYMAEEIMGEIDDMIATLEREFRIIIEAAKNGEVII